jgi:Uma2 family endonuclease
MATRSDIPDTGVPMPIVVPPLMAGDRLSRHEFERRYEAMPRLKKAELIDGVVYVPSPVTMKHGNPDARVATWLGTYAAFTLGTQLGGNTTVRLEGDNEPQPDMLLRIETDRGGQSRIGPEGYVEGPPELVAEVAYTSANYDLHAKLDLYRRSGVKEYVVWRVVDRQIDWFVLRGAKFEPQGADTDGIIRSQVFPGLWLDVGAMLGDEMARVLAKLQEGLASPEHTEFVAKLKRAADKA